MARKKHLISVHTSTGTTAPTNASLYLGEIAVQHTPNNPALWIKVGTGESSTDYEKFIGETEINNLYEDSKILGSGYTYSGIPYVNSATTITAAYSALTREFCEDEKVVAAALNDLNERVNELSGNTGADTESLSASVINLSATTTSHVNNTDLHLPSVSSSDDGKVLRVVEGEWTPTGVTSIWAGTDDPDDSLGEDGDIYLKTNPVVLYETDGTTGLLGHNNDDYANYWQLENLDLTPYKYIKCYFKASNLTAATGYTPAVIVTVPLDTAAKGPTIYTGGVMVGLPFNRNRQYLVSCAVDSTKTKFQVIHQNTLWDVTASDANNNGRYLYKIEGYV